VTRKNAEKAPKTKEVQQEVLPSENFDLLEESYIIPKVRVRKSQKVQEVPQITTKRGRKRKLSEKVTEVPEKKTRDSEIRSSTSSRDEGFMTDESAVLNDDFDVRYVPDNSRYPFRKRRYMRPWWIHSGDTDQRYEVGFLSAADVQAEKKMQKIKKNMHINLSKVAANTILKPRPAELLKMVEEVVVEKERLSKLTKGRKSKNISGTNEKAAREEDPSKVVANAFEKMSGDEGFNVVEQYENFSKK
jgi:hypothetical protein